MSEAMKQLPKYRCHKEVWAIKILDIVRHNEGDPKAETDGSALLCPEEHATYAPIKVGSDYMRKHNPHVGGYYVQYKDGYESFSPAEPFESGYTPVQEDAARTQQIERNFTYHPPKPGQPERYQGLRNAAYGLAILLDVECPDSREKSLAMTKLEEAVFWANASIARNE